MIARNTEAALGWTQNVFFSGAHGAMFYFADTRLQLGTVEYVLVCFGGIVLAAPWFNAGRRVRRLMSFWNQSLSALESREPETLPRFASPEFRAADDARLTGSTIFLVMIG